uniref:embryonic polyadenylate-binding protein 2 n=1 Tax=Odobenus rosmarus divergens TaxID=9708 RepID=UPI00063C0B6B|nr:PREDICTED: embryonic polyadenylate-binding protein 2 [Odobenus rosmarus divergens]
MAAALTLFQATVPGLKEGRGYAHPCKAGEDGRAPVHTAFLLPPACPPGASDPEDRQGQACSPLPSLERSLGAILPRGPPGAMLAEAGGHQTEAVGHGAGPRAGDAGAQGQAAEEEGAGTALSPGAGVLALPEQSLGVTFFPKELPLCPGTPMEKVESDHRSVYVGNVDCGGTAEHLEAYFNPCGEGHQVTVLCNKFSGHPKGYAYMEFAVKSSAQASAELDESIFRGQVIKVLPKRTNLPGISSTDRGALEGQQGARGGPFPRSSLRGRARFRPRGRNRGSGRFSLWYSPY